MRSFPYSRGFSRTFRVAPALAAAVLAGCTCAPDPYGTSLSEDAAAAFATCSEAEIRFLAAKHNVQLVFGPCGSNAFSSYRWSPDGLRIYFQLVHSANVMDADAPDKRTVRLAVPSPTGPAAWISPTRVAVPVGPEAEGGPARLAVLDVPSDVEPGASVATRLELHELRGVAQVRVVQGTQAPDELLVAGLTSDGAPGAWRVGVDDGALQPTWPWLTEAFDTLTYTPEQQAVVLGQGDTVRLVDATTGEVQSTWEHARRGALDPSGRWVVLEHLGDPVSVFDQRTWDDVPEQVRRRELARAQALADRLPDAFEREVRPPTLSVVDRSSGERWSFTGFQGDGFQWYPATPGFGSFFLWGFEGKQYKRNVALLDLRPLLVDVEDGKERMGLQRFAPPHAAAPPEGEATRAEAPAPDAAD